MMSSTPLAAQCASGDCSGNNDGQGPAISIGVEKYTYHAEPGVPVAVAVSLSLTDFDLMKQESLLVTLTYAQGSETVTGWTWEPTDTGTYVLSTGTVNLTAAGSNVLTVRVEDRFGNAGTASETLTLTHADTRLPRIDTDTYHNEYRDLGQSQFTVGYTLPSYTSLGVARATSLFYQSERVNPSAYVHLDAQPGVQNASEIVALSMQLLYPGGNYPATREYFWAKDAEGGKQRLGIYWPLPGQPTGAYMEQAAVRAYKADGTYFETRVPVRLLVVNDTRSRYGAGWSVAGVQRIWGNNDGVMLIEGDGVVRWFANERCNNERCHYVSPEGDFTTLTYEYAQMQFVRTYSDGSTATFEVRGDQGLMRSATDAFGRVTKYEWRNTTDAAPVPVLAKITDPVGKVTTFTYSAAGYLQQITDPAGRTTSFTHTANGDLTAIAGVTAFGASYDASHRIKTYTDEQGTFDVTFNRGTFSSLAAPAVTLSNGTQSRPVTQFRRAEWVTTLLDGQGTGLGDLAPALPTRLAVEETIDPLGHSISVLKNRYGQSLKTADLASGILTLTSWNRDGLPLSVSYPNYGGPEVYEWNDFGQLLSKRVDDAFVYTASYLRTDRGPYYEYSGGVARWHTYGERGELRRSWHGAESDSVTNGTAYEYDEMFRLKKVVGPKGETSEWTYGLNPWGNVDAERHILSDGTAPANSYSYDDTGRVCIATNATGHTESMTYDARNRVLTLTRTDGKVERHDYTGPYLTQFTDAAGKPYKFTHNALGWLMSEIFPDGKTRTYAYDLDGLLVKATDRRGWAVETRYDDAHRPVSIAAEGAATATYSYPDTFTTSATNDVATVSSTVVPTSGHDRMTVSFAGLPDRLYEIKDVMNHELTPIGTDVNTFVNGVLANTSSTRYAVTRGAAGAMNLAITNNAGKTTTLVRDGTGRHVQTNFPMGLVQQNLYWNDGRLRETSYNRTANERLGTSYSYDLLGRVKTRGLVAGGAQWAYEYDELGRLTHYQDATHPERYSYDAADNRTDSGSTLEPNSNRYATFAGYTFTYDAEGNLIRKYSSSTGFDQRLTWNALNQLTSVSVNGKAVTYGYDPAGRRVRRTQNGVTTYSLYDTDDLVMEMGSSGEAVRTYTYWPGVDTPLSVREVVGGAESEYYYILERPGHVRALLDAYGEVANEYRYTPFGQLLSTVSGTAADSPQPLRFMARELDATTKLYYVRNRWYDPLLARFVSEDPIGLAGGPNTYAYVDNNPITFRDPSGLTPDPCDLYPWMNMCQTSFANPFLLPTVFVTAYDRNLELSLMSAGPRSRTEPTSSFNYPTAAPAIPAAPNPPAQMRCDTALAFAAFSAISDGLFLWGGFAMKGGLATATMSMKQGIATGTLTTGSRGGKLLWDINREAARATVRDGAIRLGGGVVPRAGTTHLYGGSVAGAVPIVGTVFVHGPRAWRACGGPALW